MFRPPVLRDGATDETQERARGELHEGDANFRARRAAFLGQDDVGLTDCVGVCRRFRGAVAQNAAIHERDRSRAIVGDRQIAPRAHVRHHVEVAALLEPRPEVERLSFVRRHERSRLRVDRCQPPKRRRRELLVARRAECRDHRHDVAEQDGELVEMRRSRYVDLVLRPACFYCFCSQAARA